MAEKQNKNKKEKKIKKKRPIQELDTETTFADMNVEGFKWYNPNKKKGRTQVEKLSRKEYWALVRGAYRAMLPLIACMLISGALVVLLAYLWLS